jgi:hypothetical protein
MISNAVRMIVIAGEPIAVGLSYSHDKIVLLNGQESLYLGRYTIHSEEYNRAGLDQNTGV